MLKATQERLNSCIYRVNVVHQRLLPKKHRFEYGLFMFMLDLDEAEQINQCLKLAKINRRALYHFDNEDHFALTPVSTREKLAAYLASKGIGGDFGRVLLLTNFRFLGYVFNPVSIYFVHDKSGEPLLAVAEVGNTFLERKPFLLPLVKDEQTGKSTFKLTAPKQFYVSPFSRVDDTFEFICNSPTDSLEIHINTRAGVPQAIGSQSGPDAPSAPPGPTTLVSSLRGRRIELSDSNIIRCTLRYPFVTLGVIGLIHAHALLLWLKRLPFFLKEENLESQRELINPHSSLKNLERENEILSVHAYKGAAR